MVRHQTIIALGAAVAVLAGANSVSAQPVQMVSASLATDAAAAVADKVGVAGWYGEAFDGRTTASGEMFDMYRLTAADPNLPLGALVQVTNLQNGRSVVVRINDRRNPGPNGVIVLSKAAAANLEMLNQGQANVRVHRLD
jgi:rare lipoprotein A (peptidoglycan hydrolase)